MKLIASRDNADFKALRLLAKDGRARAASGRTLLDGPHLLAEYRARVGQPLRLAVNESGAEHAEIQRLLRAMPEVPVLRLRDALFNEISGVASPVGVLAEIAIPAPPAIPVRGVCVALEAVQDAGNVGAILRSAAAAGAAAVITGAGCASLWSPRVLRAAQGAHFAVDLIETDDLPGFVRGFAGTTIATVADQTSGESLYALDLRGDVAWIFGNEGAGLSAELIQLARQRARIPLASGVESLNVAAAAAICLFEARRQRL